MCLHMDCSWVMLLSLGSFLPADIIITATGLNLRVMSDIEFVINSKRLDIPSCLLFRDCLISELPNATMCMGYINSSWTLKCDMTCSYFCDIINHMDRRGYKEMVVRPQQVMKQSPMFNVTSGYIVRSQSKFPMCGDESPWVRLNNFFFDYLNFSFFQSKITKEFQFR